MRVYNFSAGPPALPEEVLKRVQSKLLNYENNGMSVMEMSHRSKEYEAINDEAEALLRELMNVPANYSIAFVQGGATTQFESVPLNIYKNGKADYVVTGIWAEKAFKEADKFTDAKCIASSKEKAFSFIPKITKNDIRPDADYLHICHNNTIVGTRFNYIPSSGNVPIVNDMSSSILSEEINVADYGMIYAGAQKNIGPSGATVLIIRNDLLEMSQKICPSMLKWKSHTDAKSIFHTPPTFSIYFSMEIFRWLKEIGGVKAIEKINIDKAKMLYDHIDNSKLFANNVAKEDRSLMNVPFVSPSKEMDAKFLAEAKKAGLVTLAGHNLVGGMRASIYNAMPVAGVKALIEFMKKFEKENS